MAGAAFAGPFGLVVTVIGIGCLCAANALTDDRLEALLKQIPLNNHEIFNFDEITRKNNLKFYLNTNLDFIGIGEDSKYNFINKGKYNYKKAQNVFLEVQDKITSIEQCPQKGQIDTGFGDEEAYFTEYMETHISSRLFEFKDWEVHAKAYFIEDNDIRFDKARDMRTSVRLVKNNKGRNFAKVSIYPEGTFSKWDREEDDVILEFCLYKKDKAGNILSRVPFEKDKYLMYILDWEGYYNKGEKKYYFNNDKLTKESEMKMDTHEELIDGDIN